MPRAYPLRRHLLRMTPAHTRYAGAPHKPVTQMYHTHLLRIGSEGRNDDPTAPRTPATRPYRTQLLDSQLKKLSAKPVRHRASN